MIHWAFWRKRPSASGVGAGRDGQPPTSQRLVDPMLLGEALQGVLAWLLPSSAVVVGAMGQVALSIVLLAFALGVWLRLWRSRKRQRNRSKNS